MTKQQVLEAYGNLSLSFESNQGQTDKQVNYLARGRGYALFLTPTEAVLVLGKPNSRRTQNQKRQTPSFGKAEADHIPTTTIVRMQLLGASPHPKLVGLDELPGKSNYFIGNDPKAWHTNVANYAKVRYEAVYPGVDVVYYGNQRQLEYDFVVAPGADPKAIRLSFNGADKASLDGRGDLILYTSDGALRLHKPLIYQHINGIKQVIPGRYLLEGNHHVGFQVAHYDASIPLVIDPILSYSTYLGGGNTDQGHGIAVDSAGSVYVTGETFSTNFPTASPLQPAKAGNTDAFVTKLNAAGSALVYSTYLGGGLDDRGFGIAVDAAGSAYVTGETDSTNFPTVNPVQSTIGSTLFPDAFVTKLNPAGSALVYSTYLGGSLDDRGFAIAVDAAGSAYVTGVTDSANFFPTVSPLQPALGGLQDAFVTKLNAAGSALVYSTYLGGGNTDQGHGIAVDSAGSVYVTGETFSTNFPTASPLQPAKAGNTDAFVTKLNAAGSALVYSTYLGGGLDDRGFGIAVDAAGSAYVTGETDSTNFPTTIGAFDTTCGSDGLCDGGGLTDAFVAKLNGAGSALAYSTYLGGSSTDQGFGIAVEPCGNAYVTGETFSTNFPTASPFQATKGGNTDAFVTKLNPAGSALVYSTYLGGSLDDRGFGIAVDTSGNAYTTGSTDTNSTTDSPVFPTTAGAFQTAFGGVIDAFIAKIAETTTGADLCIAKTDSPDPVTVGSSLTYTITVTNNGPDLATSVELTDTLPGSATFVSSSATCTGTSTLTCALGSLASSASTTVTIVVTPTLTGTLSNTAGVTSSVSDPNLANNSVTISTTVNTTGAGGGALQGECAIATAAFESPLAAEVQILREFRNRSLLTNVPGRFLVAAYYRLSPPLADLIREHEAIRAATRGLLWPVVWWAHLALTWPILAFPLGGGAFLAGSLLPYHLLRARRARVPRGLREREQ